MKQLIPPFFKRNLSRFKQEMADFVEDAFDIAFKYRAPVLILSDGLIGQMMEKVYLKEQTPRLTNEELIEKHGSNYYLNK